MFILFFSVFPVPSGILRTTEKNRALSFLLCNSLQQVFVCITEIPFEPPLLQFQLCWPFLIGKVILARNHLCGLLLDSPQYVHISLVLGGPHLDTVFVSFCLIFCLF